MSLFLWYVDEKLAAGSQSASPISEFSFFFFMGVGSRKSSRPASPLYIREEIGTMPHYNVYLQNDRWDILPVGAIAVDSLVG